MSLNIVWLVQANKTLLFSSFVQTFYTTFMACDATLLFEKVKEMCNFVKWMMYYGDV